MNQLISHTSLRELIGQVALNYSQWRLIQDFDKFYESIRNRPSQPHEMINDWKQACAYIISIFIKGEINFSNLTSDCYPIFEDIWVKEIKLHMAYLNYLNEPSNTKEHNYYTACNTLQGYLNNSPNLPLKSFESVREFLNKHYLTNDRIDFNKTETEKLIVKKAARIIENTGPKAENWHKAKSYIIFFYDNIVAAVLKKDKNSIAKVLEAFKCSVRQNNCLQITNAFETIIAILFLNKKIIKSIINGSKNNFSLIYCDIEWPVNTIKDIKNLRYFKDQKMMEYQGHMSSIVRDGIVKNLTNPEQIAIIDELYNQSQLSPTEKKYF